LYFFPEPHPQGSLRPVLLLIVPSGSELHFPSQSLRPFPLSARVGSTRTLKGLWHTQRFAQADRSHTNPEFEREMGVPLKRPVHPRWRLFPTTLGVCPSIQPWTADLD
jgi:hypothetical protein